MTVSSVACLLRFDSFPAAERSGGDPRWIALVLCVLLVPIAIFGRAARLA